MYKHFNLENILLSMLGIFASFLAPLAPFLILCASLVFIDTITGIRAAYKRGEKIRSRVMRNTVEKIVWYFTAILLSEAMKMVLLPQVPITYVTACYICIIEFKSNIENISALTNVDIWKHLAEKINLFKTHKKDD